MNETRGRGQSPHPTKAYGLQTILIALYFTPCNYYTTRLLCYNTQTVPNRILLQLLALPLPLPLPLLYHTIPYHIIPYNPPNNMPNITNF